MIVSWKEANSSDHFFMCRLLSIFSHCHILRYVYYKLPSVSGETEGHFKSAPWPDWWTPPVRSFFCALWPWSFPSSKGHWGALGLAFFNIFTDIGKVGPRKWRVKGHLEGAGVGSLFSFCSNRRGRDAENASPEDGKSVCLGQTKQSDGVETGSHRGRLQTVIRCSQELCLFTVA